MEKEQAYELAKEIIHLDLLRDQKWEMFIAIAGNHAHEIFRMIQNGRTELSI